MADTTTKVKAPSKIKGKTLGSEFDGVTVPTLRAWMKYWSTPARCKDDPALKGDRATAQAHIDLIQAELTARGK